MPLHPFPISAKKNPPSPRKALSPQERKHNVHHCHSNEKAIGPSLPLPHSTHHKSTQNHTTISLNNLALLPILVFPSSIPRRLACAPSTLSFPIFPPCFHIHDQALCAPCTLCALCLHLLQHKNQLFSSLNVPFYRLEPVCTAASLPPKPHFCSLACFRVTPSHRITTCPLHPHYFLLIPLQHFSSQSRVSPPFPYRLRKSPKPPQSSLPPRTKA